MAVVVVAAVGAGPAANTGEIKAMLRGELKALDGEIASALRRSPDVVTRRHLEDARHQISEIVKPKGSASGEGGGDGFRR